MNLDNINLNHPIVFGLIACVVTGILVTSTNMRTLHDYFKPINQNQKR